MQDMEHINPKDYVIPLPELLKAIKDLLIQQQQASGLGNPTPTDAAWITKSVTLQTGTVYTMSLKTRPLVVNKFREYVGDRSVTIRSKRLLEEMKVFVWKNGRPEAQTGYNDDLVMSFGIGLYVRDTALRFGESGTQLSKSILNSFTKTSYNSAVYSPNNYSPTKNWNMDVNGSKEDIKWLI